MEQAKFVVIFRSVLKPDVEGYAEWAEKMLERVQRVDGFVASQSFRDESGQGVTLSYWRDKQAIARWSQDEQHRLAKSFGKQNAYSTWQIEVCQIEQAWGS